MQKLENSIADRTRFELMPFKLHEGEPEGLMKAYNIAKVCNVAKVYKVTKVCVILICAYLREAVHPPVMGPYL